MLSFTIHFWYLALQSYSEWLINTANIKQDLFSRSLSSQEVGRVESEPRFSSNYFLIRSFREKKCSLNSIKCLPTMLLKHNYTTETGNPSCSHMSSIIAAVTMCWVSSQSRLLHQKPHHHHRQRQFTSIHTKTQCSCSLTAQTNYPSFDETLNLMSECDFCWFSHFSLLCIVSHRPISPLRFDCLGY